MKKLSETSVFKYTELLGASKLSDAISKLINERYGAKFLTEKNLEDVFYKIRHKSFNYKAKFALLELFRKGTIRLVYNPMVRVTTAVPFVTVKNPTTGNASCVIVNVTNYAKIDADNVVTIDPLILYTLMLSAAYSMVIDGDFSMLAMNGLPDLYADMFVSVAARMSNLDMIRREKIKFIITKYIYIQLGFGDIKATEYAKQSIRYLDEYSATQLDEAFPIQSFETLESICMKMKEVMPEFRTITFGNMFDRWMRMYGESTAFAIEYIPYFITTFCSLITSCNAISNVKAIEKEAAKDERRMIILFDRIETSVSALSTR